MGIPRLRDPDPPSGSFPFSGEFPPNRSVGPVDAATPSPSPGCELCAATPFTEWFYEDDECWVAECESCSVPMIVWRRHHPQPPTDVRRRLHERLTAVIGEHFTDEIWIDENMRTIPTHYHAHARPRRGFPNQPLTRRSGGDRL